MRQLPDFKQVCTGLGLMLLAGCGTNPPATPPQAAANGHERPLAGPFATLAYPENMQHHNEMADVEIGCTVDVTGHPQDCKVLSLVGNSDAAKAALDYVTHARYSPRTHNGVPVTTYHTWKIHFRLGASLPSSTK